MIFEKPPCNNREVPLYSLRKLWEEFMMGHHVKSFDISDFKGWVVGLHKIERMIGPHPPR